jgi:hypothetical protein
MAELIDINKQLKDKAIDIKGKDYVMVKDRVTYFNDTYPNGSITTSIISADGSVVVVQAVIVPDVKNMDRKFTGVSASNPSKSIEKMTPYEVAETSAVGRALAFMGIGVIDSIASADEMNKTIHTPTYNQPKATPENDVMVAYQATLVGKACPDCGAPMTTYKSGKVGCSKYCWKNKVNNDITW